MPCAAFSPSGACGCEPGAGELRVDRGRLVVDGAGAVPTDRVITLSRLAGPALAGLPHDESGFIPTDPHDRVQVAPDVYAAGDITTFPLKQGGSPPNSPGPRRRGRGRDVPPPRAGDGTRRVIEDLAKRVDLEPV
jgi:hypothetical protein